MVLTLKILLIGHFLGDYYLQTDTLSKDKCNKVSSLLLHVAIYTLVQIALILCIFTNINLFYIIVLGLSHFIIDYMKSFITKNKKISTEYWYCIDQLLHIISLIIFSYLINNSKIDYQNWIPASTFDIFISWILLILFIIKPTSITIKVLLEKYQPKENTIEKGIPNAGAFIGILERILILLMLTIQEYSGIGLVITAKSIVRYKKIAEDPIFSEYYLIGTLLSTIIVILSYILLITINI